jgi:hypothetical protein
MDIHSFMYAAHGIPLPKATPLPNNKKDDDAGRDTLRPEHKDLRGDPRNEVQRTGGELQGSDE